MDKPETSTAGARRRLVVDLWLAGALLGAAFLISLAFPPSPGQPSLATVLYDRHGNLLATLSGENRQPVTLEEVPAFLRQAVIATEDAGFYRHGGVSLRGIVRAFLRDLAKGRFAEGASTITQQLARSLYLTPRRTIWRKLLEIYHAFRLELHLGKDEILARYLSHVFVGEGAYGLKAAAEIYFGRPLSALNRAEQALLAGILRAPARYNPWRHPEAARERLRVVLGRMQACGYLQAREAAAIAAEPIRARRQAARKRNAPYFVGYVQNFLAGLLPEGSAGLFRAGLQVQTTLDRTWQDAAEAAMGRLAATGAAGPEGCLVALDPQTGAIRAMVGGRDYAVSQFNRATQARRQPGSAFKPIVYAAALERGYTLATLRSCEPHQFLLGKDSYLPVDAGKPYHQSRLNLRDALAASCNVIAVALGSELGPAEVASFAHRLGIDSPLRPYLSLPLGTSEIRPVELAAAYAVFANGGRRVAPFGVESVRTADGRLLYRAPRAGARVIKASSAFLLTQALTGVFAPGGTAAGLGPGRPAAGKTGTSDGNRDAWFAGYTPDLVAVVQIGYDRGNRPLPGSGGSLAAPIWSDFVRRASHGLPIRDFLRPDEVQSIAICRETGELPGPGCPVKVEYFARGTEPAAICTRHRLVQLLVCRRSGLLPGANCRHVETREFRPDEIPIPTAICTRCRGGLLDFLERIFGRRRRPAAEEQPGEEGPPAIRPSVPDTGRRWRGVAP
ncbi:MAG: transglycosylase domain-containing protein [Bacteroidota bacterium]